MFLFISSLLLLLSISIINYKEENKKVIILNSIFLVIFGIISMLFFISDYFTGKGITESVISSLSLGLNQAGISEYLNLIIFSVIYLVLLLLLSVFYVTKNSYIKEKLSNIKILDKTIKYKKISYLLILFAFISNPFSIDIIKLFKSNTNISKDFHKYYISPTPTASDNKKNIVFLYLEGIEETFLREKYFPDLAKGLNLLKNESYTTEFTNLYQTTGSEYTIAGMVSTQCGIPLFSNTFGNSISAIENFYPKSTCMGDILKKEGYFLSFIQGSDTRFSGINNFYKTHKFDEILGFKELTQYLENPNYRNGWGLYDDTTMDLFFNKFIELSKKKENFGLFGINLDTHAPNGMLSKSCKNDLYKDGRNSILNTVKCSTNMVTNFVKKVLESEYSENTIIVLSSDHLMMRNSASNTLNKIKDRKRLFYIIDKTQKDNRKIDKLITPIDIGPTVLSYIGIKTEDMGLGKNILKKESLLTSFQGDIKEFNKKLLSWKKDILDFWDTPKIPENIEINIIEKNIKINNNQYPLPILIKEKNNELSLFFEQDIVDKLPKQFQTKLEEEDNFIYIDSCSRLSFIFEKQENGIFCLAQGKYKKSFDMVNIDTLDSFKINDFKIYDKKYNFPSMEKDLVNNRKMQKNMDELIKHFSQDRNRFIAHAGGSIEGDKYTNSLEALDLNYKKGFRLFELDIIKTIDGYYVASHDWKHWKDNTDFKGEIPTLEEFKNIKFKGKYTTLGMKEINKWFKEHPDAILVTDKVNTPKEFSEQFIDKKRLVMELFSWEAVKEAFESGIAGPMPTWNLITQIKKNHLEFLLKNNIKFIAASRRILNLPNVPLFLQELQKRGIVTFAFHVNFDKGKDEEYVLCNEFAYFYGMYADEWDFSKPMSFKDCEKK